MKNNTATYECLRGHITTVHTEAERINIAIRCPKCIERACYQPTDAELDAAYQAWHKEEMKKPQPRIVYSPEAQADRDVVSYPYGQ